MSAISPNTKTTTTNILEQIMNKQMESKSVLRDGLNMPMRVQHITCSGSAFLKSFQEYLKPIFLVLKNSDLHIYQDLESETHMEMHVL